MTAIAWSVGSQWHRWDPHLHAPGTLRNDQFGGDWDEYIRRLGSDTPSVSALGITDYFSLRTYKEVVRRREAGALASVPLVFPNVELRLTIETDARQGVNLHFLVCPDDPRHIALVEERLGKLSFTYKGEEYSCTDDSLRRLGRAHKGNDSLDDDAALREGANQFKVELTPIRRLVEGDSWFRSNVLIAVAAGKDGLGGLAKDASFRAHREEIGRFADIVFSGQPSDRSYWLGGHPDFASNGQTPKPCLHGSDAHSLDAVLAPALNRRCWIRANPTFEGLRQAIAEPERRVFIGDEPPNAADPAHVIKAVRFRNADWIENGELILNDGLITIIGAKGSGKTALADLIATAADAKEADPGPASFTKKAGELLNGLQIELEWADDTTQPVELPSDVWWDPEPRVRYLSQQFVERLCAPSGLAEPLVKEIESVVFNAIPHEERLECGSFDELREVIVEDLAAERYSARELIRVATERIAVETQAVESLKALESKNQEAQRLQDSLVRQIAVMPPGSGDAKHAAHQAAVEQLQRLREAIASGERRAKDLKDVGAEVRRQVLSANSALASLRERYPTLLDSSIWESLALAANEHSLAELQRLEREARDRVRLLRDSGLPDTPQSTSVGLACLVETVERIGKELGLDQTRAKKRADLEAKLATAKHDVEKVGKEVDWARGAKDRRSIIQRERIEQYERVFETLIQEEKDLRQLYSSVHDRMAGNSHLQKLEFVVQRDVDIESWVDKGESLFDLRKPPFNGHGVLKQIAEATLLPAWKRGSASQVREAMDGFIQDNASKALGSLLDGRSNRDFGEWLFSTDHINIRYGVRYEGVDIGNLSPGTRGVVLLTLFLALDQEDQRPLLIDQPEENLDPSSVFEVLVPFFREAARRRQIVMVTHNANLVVNTDSDQVIVAEATRVAPIQLPRIRYEAGGLEDPFIRKRVCALLEGGEEAFRRRGQRYGSDLRTAGRRS